MGFWMLQSEQAIIRCTAAGEQKQGHGDAELLLKERQHSRGLGQPTGTNRPTKSLTRLIREGDEQFVQAKVLERLKWRDAFDAIEAEIKAVQADAKRFSHRRDLNRVAKVLAEIMQRVGHHLHWASAAAGDRLIDLGHDITTTAGFTCEHHLTESRDTDHVLSPSPSLHGQQPWCHCLEGNGTHCKVR
jgi:hypothetical protein